MKRLHPKTINEVQGKERYQVKISKRIATLKNLDDNADINTVWEITFVRENSSIRENIKISAKESLCYYSYELREYKPYFSEECSKLTHSWS
jgi:hypothetical protein